MRRRVPSPKKVGAKLAAFGEDRIPGPTFLWAGLIWRGLDAGPNLVGRFGCHFGVFFSFFFETCHFIVFLKSYTYIDHYKPRVQRSGNNPDYMIVAAKLRQTTLTSNDKEEKICKDTMQFASLNHLLVYKTKIQVVVP